MVERGSSVRFAEVVQVIAIALGALLFSGVLGQDGTPSHDASVSNVANPYGLSFDDFEWDSSVELEPIDGAKPIGKPISVAGAIEMFEQRVAANPEDFANRTVLGSLLLRRAKEEDDLAAYAVAEKQLRTARQLNSDYLPATLALAQVLLARHEFGEALQLAQELDAAKPNRPATLAALFDSQLELGRYTDAAETLERLQALEQSAPILARAARLAELRGKRAKALTLLDFAIADLRASGSNASVAWYHWRKGGLYFDEGNLERAVRCFRKALAADPNDEAALVGLAKTQFADGDLAGSISSLQRAAEGNAPPVVAMLGDALAYRGDLAEAEKLWQQTEDLMREEAKLAKVAHAREVAMFYADHDRNLEEALELSELDLQQRRDPFALDSRAWILLKNGRIDEAQQASRKALEVVAHSPAILFHAAVIEQAAGNSSRAKELLVRLQNLNPRFSITYSDDLVQLREQLGLAN